MSRDQSRQIPYLLEIALGIRNTESDDTYLAWLEGQKRQKWGKRPGVPKSGMNLKQMIQSLV